MRPPWVIRDDGVRLAVQDSLAPQNIESLVEFLEFLVLDDLGHTEHLHEGVKTAVKHRTSESERAGTPRTVLYAGMSHSRNGAGHDYIAGGAQSQICDRNRVSEIASEIERRGAD